MTPRIEPTQPVLEPCPFCRHPVAGVSDNGRGVIFHVRCGKCRAAGPGERCAADAIAAWNTRSSSIGVKEMVEALERARALIHVGYCEQDSGVDDPEPHKPSTLLPAIHCQECRDATAALKSRSLP